MHATVDCPNCGHENDMSDADISCLDSNNKMDHECSSCEEEFEVYVEFDPCYSASKIVIINCDSCGKETRNIYDHGRVFPFPKSLEGKRVCERCFASSYGKELDAQRASGTTEQA